MSQYPSQKKWVWRSWSNGAMSVIYTLAVCDIIIDTVMASVVRFLSFHQIHLQDYETFVTLLHVRVFDTIQVSGRCFNQLGTGAQLPLAPLVVRETRTPFCPSCYWTIFWLKKTECRPWPCCLWHMSYCRSSFSQGQLMYVTSTDIIYSSDCSNNVFARPVT